MDVDDDYLQQKETEDSGASVGVPTRESLKLALLA